MNQRLMQSIQWVFAVSHPISFVCFDFGFGFCACIIFTIKNNKRGSEWNTIFCHSNNEVAGFKRLVLRHFLFSILFVLLLVLLLFCIIFIPNDVFVNVRFFFNWLKFDGKSTDEKWNSRILCVRSLQKTIAIWASFSLIHTKTMRLRNQILYVFICSYVHRLLRNKILNKIISNDIFSLLLNKCQFNTYMCIFDRTTDRNENDLASMLSNYVRTDYRCVLSVKFTDRSSKLNVFDKICVVWLAQLQVFSNAFVAAWEQIQQKLFLEDLLGELAMGLVNFAAI